MIVGLAAGSPYTPLTSTTTRWFTRHRSLAVALVSAGLSVGSAVMGPLARGLISTYDWRVAMLGLGDLVWLVSFPPRCWCATRARARPTRLDLRHGHVRDRPGHHADGGREVRETQSASC